MIPAQESKRVANCLQHAFWEVFVIPDKGFMRFRNKTGIV